MEVLKYIIKDEETNYKWGSQKLCLQLEFLTKAHVLQFEQKAFFLIDTHE